MPARAPTNVLYLPVVLAAMFLSNALMIVIAAAMVSPLLLTAEARSKVPYAWVGALVLVGVGLVCLNIRFFVYLCNIALARFKGRPLTGEPLRKPYYMNVLMLVIRSAVLGLAWWLTARGMDPQVSTAHFPFIMSCGILATVAGFLVVFVPAGLGVQEVIITLTVAPILGPEAGLLAVLFRLLQTFTDLLTASLGLFMLRKGMIDLPAKNDAGDGQTLSSTALASPSASRAGGDGVAAADGARRHAPRTGKLPNFFIVGAAKCGTTSLYAYLKQHPQVFMPVHKEPLHFARDLEVPDVWCVRDDQKYAQLFAHAAGADRVGESSVWYIYSKTAAQEIKSACPDAKIIVMFRDTVDMLYSLHGQHLWNCNEDIVDFEEALAAEADRRGGRRIPPEAHMPASLLYSEVGRFAEQLQRYYDVFGRENVHVILFDDFVKDTPGVFRKVCDFLEIDPEFEPEFKVENSAKPIPMRLNRFLARHHRLRAAVRKIAGTRLLMRLNYMLPYVTRTLDRPNKIEPALRSRLIPMFKEDIEELGRMLGRDLSHWCDVNRGKRSQNSARCTADTRQ
jgi:hypothetical protein